MSSGSCQMKGSIAVLGRAVAAPPPDAFLDDWDPLPMKFENRYAGNLRLMLPQ